MRSIISLLKDVLQKIIELLGIINKKTEIELVWTNPSPTSAFAAQTVSLDLSGCTFVLIVFSTRTGANNSLNAGRGYQIALLSKGYGSLQTSTLIGNSPDAIYTIIRPVYITDTIIKFDIASSSYVWPNLAAAGAVSSPSNALNIPYQIFKIKSGGGTN